MLSQEMISWFMKDCNNRIVKSDHAGLKWIAMVATSGKRKSKERGESASFIDWRKRRMAEYFFGKVIS